MDIAVKVAQYTDTNALDVVAVVDTASQLLGFNQVTDVNIWGRVIVDITAIEAIAREMVNVAIEEQGNHIFEFSCKDSRSFSKL